MGSRYAVQLSAAMRRRPVGLLGSEVAYPNDSPLEHAMADEIEPQDPPDGAEAEPEQFLNRAARRAKGKGGAPTSQPSSGGSKIGDRGPVAGQRQWANRRSG